MKFWIFPTENLIFFHNLYNFRSKLPSMKKFKSSYAICSNIDTFGLDLQAILTNLSALSLSFISTDMTGRLLYERYLFLF